MSLEENIVELETSEFYDEAQTTANSMIEKINPDHQQNWYENNSYKDEIQESLSVSKVLTAQIKY